MKIIVIIWLMFLSTISQAQPTQAQSPQIEHMRTFITFKLNSAQLSLDNIKYLNEFLIQKNITVYEVKIESQAAEGEDISLSQERANGVKKLLTEAKVKEGSIKIKNKGYGNNTEKCETHDLYGKEQNTVLYLEIEFTK